MLTELWKIAQHTFQILTKRSERLRKLAAQLPWPRHIWMGVSVEDYLRPSVLSAWTLCQVLRRDDHCRGLDCDKRIRDGSVRITPPSLQSNESPTFGQCPNQSTRSSRGWAESNRRTGPVQDTEIRKVVQWAYQRFA